MHMFCKYTFFTIVFTFVFINLSIAQDKESKGTSKEKIAIAEKAIKDLKEGILIVRLKSKHSKISKLQSLSSSKDVDNATKARIKNTLKREIEERNTLNNQIVKGFEEFYYFSTVYFMYDTSSISLKNGVQEGIFLNNNLEVDPTIKLNNKPFFVLRYGTTDLNNTSGIEAWVVMNKQLEDMERPFPYHAALKGIDNFKQLLREAFDPRTKAERKALKKRLKGSNSMDKTAIKLNSKFRLYHSRVLVKERGTIYD